VAAAINDTVREKEHFILYLLYGAVLLMCWISFRSIRAALCVLLPLVLVTELGHSLMVHLGIGMKINTLCVVALGVGIGVDYGIYIFARMREAMLQGKSLSESYFIALKTTGIAIFYTALTLAVGVAMWMFSVLKFQADMGILLTFMFIVNMIAAIIFLPALCRWLLRPGEKDSFDVSHWHEKPDPGSTPGGVGSRRRIAEPIAKPGSTLSGAIAGVGPTAVHLNRRLARPLWRGCAGRSRARRRGPSRRPANRRGPTWSAGEMPSSVASSGAASR
jgi:uncharacterized membrane protein YdfJ with MMPL/SSD domain